MKNLIRLTDINKHDVENIFKLADNISDYDGCLEGKTIVMFFPDSSIRTRVSFEKAVHILGAQGILFPTSTLDKKEALQDVTGYLDNWSDCLIIRHNNIERIKTIANHSKNTVINAMTSVNHPCEILSDLYSLSKIRKNYLKDKYLFMGASGNIGMAWNEASQLLGLDLVQCCPEGYEIEGVHVINNLEKAIKGRDIILTDPLPSEAISNFEPFRISETIMKQANKNALLNPCPPFKRGEEVSEDAVSSNYFVGYDFKANLLCIQQAIILYFMGY